MVLTKLFVSKNSYLFGFLILAFACNTPGGHSKTHKDKSQGGMEGTTGAENKDGAHRLHLNLQPSSKYYYTINNEYDLALEAQGKKHQQQE